MEKKAWDRQKREGTRPFMAFQIYLKMGLTRQIKQVAEKIERSEKLLYGWSSKWNWVERAAEYDLHQASIKQAAEDKADAEYFSEQRKKFRRDQMRVGQAMYAVAASAIPHLRGRSEILNAHEVAKLTETASKEISRALGDPDIIAESRGGVPASGAVIDAPFAQFLMDWAKNPKGQIE